MCNTNPYLSHFKVGFQQEKHRIFLLSLARPKDNCRDLNNL